MPVQILPQQEKTAGKSEALASFLANMIQGGTKSMEDRNVRRVAASMLGIPEDQVPMGITRQDLVDMQKEKFKSSLDPEKKLFETLLSGINKSSTPPIAPEGSIMPGTQPVTTTQDNLGLDQGKLLRGLISKKMGVPYEQMMTQEEKQKEGQQVIQQKVNEARALEEGKPLSADAAGKLAMVKQAESDLNDAESLLFPGGKFSPGMAIQTNFPGGGFPATEGRQVFSKILNAVNAKLRIETGAQANPEEVKNILQRFLPTARDSDTTAKDKFRRLKEFMSDTKSILDPRGRFDKSTPQVFNSEQEALNSGVKGEVIINGRRARID